LVCHTQPLGEVRHGPRWPGEFGDGQAVSITGGQLGESPLEPLAARVGTCRRVILRSPQNLPVVQLSCPLDAVGRIIRPLLVRHGPAQLVDHLPLHEVSRKPRRLAEAKSFIDRSVAEGAVAPQWVIIEPS
jgi:hypothetical protein